MVDLAAGTVAVGSDTDHLRSIEAIVGSAFNDIYVAANFGAAGFLNPLLNNVGDNGTFNEFEGREGNDTIAGNGNTRIAFYNATEGVKVDLAAGTAIGGPSVGIDTLAGVNAARGSEFNDVILGDANPNTLEGRGGNDILNGRGGNDSLTGGDGSDIIIYATGPSDGGADTITDFDASEGDRIDLRAFGTIHNTADVLALSTQSGASATLINFGSGNTLTVQGAVPSTLLPSRFIFNGMVAVTVQTTAGFDFSRLYDDIAGANPSLGTHDSTHFSMVNTAAGVTINLIGSFSYDGNGNVLPGSTITATDIYDLVNNILVNSDGWNFSATQLFAAIQTYATSHDHSGLDAIFTTVAYSVVGNAGADNLTGGALDDVLIGLGGNDDLQGFGGDDILRGDGNRNTAVYTDAADGIAVDMASGTVHGIAAGDAAHVGNDTLRNIVDVQGSNFADTYVATGFSATSLNAGVGNNINSFEGMGGSDDITGNGNTQVSYLHALAGVRVDLNVQTAFGYDPLDPNHVNPDPLDAANIGTDTFHGGVNRVRGSTHDDFLFGTDSITTTEQFVPDGGNDFIDGRGGIDLVSYGPLIDYDLTSGVHVFMAAGSVTPIVPGDSSVGTDTLQSIEQVRGTNFADIYDASGFGLPGALNIGSNGTYNQFEGMGGSDTTIGNGNTEIAFSNATGGVTVNFVTGTASGNPSVGTDTFSGVGRVLGSGFDDTIVPQVDDVSQMFDGSGGIDTVDYSTYTTPLTVALNGGTAISVTGSGVTGPDTIVNIENFTGSTSTDHIAGDALANVLKGGAGADVIIGGGGNDTIIQTLDEAADTIDGGNGTDTVDYSAFTTGLTVILNTSTAVTVVGSAANALNNDTVKNIENFISSTGGDQVTGDNLNNTFFATSDDAQDVFDGADGTGDTANYSAYATNLTATLNGSTNATVVGSGTTAGTSDIIVNVENFTGGAGNDTITGDANNNILIGGLGSDTVVGMGGSDTFIATFDDVRDTFDGGAGAGVDTANYSAYTGALTVTLNGGAASTVFGSGSSNGSSDTIQNVENFIGGAGNDTITGDNITTNTNTLTGGLGADIINGGGGNDTIIQTLDEAADTIDGGNGTDTVDYSAFTTGLTVILNTSTAVTVVGSAANALNNDTVKNIENFISSTGGDQVTGDNLNNTFFATSDDAQDVFDGAGGTGDTANYSAYATNLTATLNGSTNATVVGSGTTAGTSDIIVNVENFTGGAGNDTITGDASNNILIGGLGSDTVVGMGGSDTFIATFDDVRDTFDGGAGAGVDTANYSAYTGALTVTLNGGAASTVFGSGSSNGSSDTIQNVENFIGGAGNDTITGDNITTNTNTLTGGLGADIINGGDGNDTIFPATSTTIDDAPDVIDGGAGSDTVNYSAYATNLTVTLSLSTLATVFGSGSTVATSDKIVNIENFSGGSGNDTITGDGNNNILIGGFGADTVDGGGGSDTFIFATSDVVAGETINDTGAAGIDTIQLNSSVDFSSAATISGIEAVTFTGDAQTATFNAGQLPASLAITGAVGTQNVVVNNASSFLPRHGLSPTGLLEPTRSQSMAPTITIRSAGAFSQIKSPAAPATIRSADWPATTPSSLHTAAGTTRSLTSRRVKTWSTWPTSA